MSSISSGDIISILKSEIENFDFDTRDKEVGTVIWVGDGIVTIYGIDNAMYGEIVVFENDKKLLHFSYERYLVYQLRKEFGLEGTPIRMIVRERNEKDE